MKSLLETYGGQDYYLYTITKGNLEIAVTDYGATLCSFKYKGMDIVQGFENVHGYVEDVKYMNATIGRVCNRIAKGKFELNGKTYSLAINNGPNTLHGGINGFDTKKWQAKEDDDQLIFKYLSQDMEEGFPGNLAVEIIYKLEEDSLIYQYRAISDADTLVNICNHAFFNLNGAAADSILQDHLQIDADYIGMVDRDGLTGESLLDVNGTPFDFRKRKRIGADIETKHPQLINGNGYDHHFVIKGKGMRHFCTYDNGKLQLEVFSDLPGMHLYSGNYLDGHARGKQGNNYPRRSSICFETQYYPNAINLQKQIKPILKANELMEHTTRYMIKEI